MSKTLYLIESTDLKVDICEQIEDKFGEKQMRVGGRFQHADLLNANKRRYSRAILEREIQRVQEDLEKRKMLGELDHPDESITSLKRVSHVVTKLEMKGDEVYGEYETISTHYGKDLKALLSANTGIGISSRGTGHVIDKGDHYEVADDFQLITFDVVSDPSTPGANPVLMAEQIIRTPQKGILKESDIQSDLLQSFYKVMNLKGVPVDKMQETNVDTYIELYKDFIKDDMDEYQYEALRNALLAKDQTDATDDIVKSIISNWNASLSKIEVK